MKHWFLIIISLFVIVTSSFAQTTFDPLALSIGARALGMGKAYVAVADRGDTIFTNPAGLGEIDSFQFSSMSAKVLEEINYTVLGASYPLGSRSALGIGFASATVTDIELRNSTGAYSGKAQFNNSVFLLSYGRKFTDQFSLGLNLKYFSQDGTENNSGDGTAANLDIGLLQKGLDWLSFGLVASNVTSANKFNYGANQNDLPLSVKLGAKAQLLGQQFEAAQLSAFDLLVAIDADVSLQAASQTVTHSGLELGLPQALTLRLGFDQEQAKNYFTYGVSLRLAGVGFHYAYHPFGETSDSAAHFFSLSFDERGWPPEERPERFLGQLPNSPRS